MAHNFIIAILLFVMKVVAVVLARIGSTRLPGKTMYPLAGETAIRRTIDRLSTASTIDEIILATSKKTRDDVLAKEAHGAGIEVFRGSETDVLGRTHNASLQLGADLIVRIAGDCPLVSPKIVDHCVSKLSESGADYVSNKLKRTFPLGFDVEAFTAESFFSVDELAASSYEREHVTVYYIENKSKFDCINFTSDEIFSKEQHQDRTDIEVVLDEPADFEMLSKLYKNLPTPRAEYQKIINTVDENGMAKINESVQRTKNKKNRDSK